MRLPAITIKIEPIDADTASVSAEWKSPDGTARKLKPRSSYNLVVLDDFIGELIQELFDEVKAIEERLNG